jgi:hypothetical protein
VDVVLSLLARGHRGRIHLLSRRGILPMTHPPRMLAPLPLGERPSRLRALVRLFREASDREDARAVLDTLRPELGALWQGLTPLEQRRFLRHLRPWFDAVRHRLPPEVGARIAALEAEGRLVRHAGRVVSVREQDGRVALVYRPRGARTLAVLPVDVAIPTTGPVMDVRALDEPAGPFAARLRPGAPGPHGLGFATAADGAVLGPARGPALDAGRPAARRPLGVHRHPRDPRAGPRARRDAGRAAQNGRCWTRPQMSAVLSASNGERQEQRHEREVQHGRAIVRHHDTSIRRALIASPVPRPTPSNNGQLPARVTSYR